MAECGIISYFFQTLCLSAVVAVAVDVAGDVGSVGTG